MEPYSDPLVFSYKNTPSIAILAVEHALGIHVHKIQKNEHADNNTASRCAK